MHSIWRFDGSGGCEKCGAATGDYPSNPGKPHPNCNCSLKEIQIEEICMVEDSSTIEMVLDTITYDLGPGANPNSRLFMECEELLTVTDHHWKCCKVENGKVTDDCYEKDTTKEEYSLRCSDPFEITIKFEVEDEDEDEDEDEEIPLIC